MESLELKESQVFETPSKKERIYAFLKKKPNANIKELYFHFQTQNIPKQTLKDYKCKFRKEYNQIQLDKKLLFTNVKTMLDIFERKMTLIARLTKEEEETIKYFVELVKDK